MQQKKQAVRAQKTRAVLHNSAEPRLLTLSKWVNDLQDGLSEALSSRGSSSHWKLHLTTLRGMEKASFREAVQEQVVLPLQEELQRRSWVEGR
jgi:hypothetical protein